MAAGTQDIAPTRLRQAEVDSRQDVHRQTYLSIFAEAGLDSRLADALYGAESDSAHNPFADDAADVLTAIKARGLRTAVVSDIHFDIRPAFRRAGLDHLIDLTKPS